MCSVYEEGSCENSVLAEKTTVSNNATCRQCTERGWVVLRKKDVYCKSCFLASETHKFRAALGKTKIMKPKDRVLVAYSGSQSSAALLHLLHSGVTEEEHKKLMFSVFVLFIDEGALFNMKIEDRQNIAVEVKDKVTQYNFPIFITSLGDSLKESLVLDSSLKVCEESDIQLVKLFESIKSMSSKENFLYVMRQKLIIKAAEQLNCNKIFTAEVGTDLAVKLLSTFSLGRGDQASFETGFCDSRHPDILILRPLRDFTRKEIVFYNKFQNVEAINSPSLTTKSSPGISIQKLTEKFVTDLQEGFPSTVYTVFRTGEKIGAKSVDESSNNNICLLCNDKIRTHKGRNKYTAIEAADFSRSVSRKKLNDCGLKENCCGSCSEEKNLSQIDLLELNKFLCYGCALIVKDMDNLDSLPKNILQLAVQKKNFETMKEQIAEFLIDDTESEVERP